MRDMNVIKMKKTLSVRVSIVVPIIAIICFGIFLMPNVSASGDTGTYQIQEYNVVLIPHSNGEIEISYMQKWLVTGGHIPWVTVGLPNSDFNIIGYGGAAKEIKPDNQGGWSGVRIGLDRDYQPQETFQFNFIITQRGLLQRAGSEYRLGYTPGWYDRAFTDDLTVKLVSPAKVLELKIDPRPNSIEGQNVIWTRKNLGKGEKFTISVNFPNGTYNQTLMDKSAKGGDMTVWIIVGIIFIIVIIMAAIASSDSDGEGRGSSYSSPVIYSGASRGGGSHSHSSGGGGGFGGRSTSCACACVSCACACACAGGGGAGCTRKFRHSCSKC